MSRHLQAAGRYLPAPVAKALAFTRRALSFVIVRPESERIIAQLSDPMVESVAYLNRAMRDMQATLETALELREGHGPVLDERLLELPFIFHGLGRLPEGASVLVVARAGSTLPGSLEALGFRVRRVETPHAVLIDAGEPANAVVVVSAALDRPGAEGLRDAAKPGARLLITSRTGTDQGTLAATLRGWSIEDYRLVDSVGTQVAGGEKVMLVTAIAS